MKRIILDGSLMTDREAAHGHIAAAMGFPQWYGKNLDALWDMLSAYGEAEIELRCAPALLNSLERYGCRLLFQFFSELIVRMIMLLLLNCG